MFNELGDWPCRQSINFLHNWRCAGSTLSSLLSANFHQSYLKIGHPFDSFGWPENYQKHRPPLISLSQLRLAKQRTPGESCIIGGHLFLGLQAALPGNWECWMNAREPIIRMKSGLLRFHHKTLKPEDQDLMFSKSTELGDPSQVDRLLRTTLKRESNGMCRRLAAYTLTKNPQIPIDEELERLSFLDQEDFEREELFEAALSNLPNISILILSQWLHESAICIERRYGLTTPLINPFSDLRHNPVELGGSSHKDRRLTDNCRAVLQEHSSEDLKLWPYLESRFVDQVNRCNIDKEEVLIRKIIHEKPLFMSRWFKNKQHDHAAILIAMARSLAKRARQAGELGDKVIETVLKWRRFTPELSDKLRDAVDKLT